MGPPQGWAPGTDWEGVHMGEMQPRGGGHAGGTGQEGHMLPVAVMPPRYN